MLHWIFLLCYKKFPVIFVGNFCAGQGKNTENLRARSSLSCVKLPKKMPFFAKIPCFSLFLTVPFVCREQVFHKPKVKDSLRRQEKSFPRQNLSGLCFYADFSHFFATKLPVCTMKLSNNRISPPLTYIAQNTDASLVVILQVCPRNQQLSHGE